MPPAASHRPARATRAEALAALALVALFVAVAVASARVHSGVPDETAVHVPAGFLFLETGRFAGGLGNPPLGELAVALPAWLGAGGYAPFGAQGLFAPRLVVVATGALACAALLALVRRLAREEPAGAPRSDAASALADRGAFADRGACAAVAPLGALLFLATSPTFQGHASVATLDVPVAAAVLASTLAAHRVAERATLARWLALGLALGVACATKVQGLASIPLAAAQLAFARARLGRDAAAAVGLDAHGLPRALAALAVALLVVHAAYGFAPLARGEWIPGAFLDATTTKLAHGASGHVAYLMGETSTGGWWSYFPIAMLVKSPLSELACAALGLVALARRPALLVWLGLPMAVFAGAAVASSVNIGIRHLLPFHPYWFAMAGFGLATVAARSRAAAAALAVAQLGASLFAAPHGLAYFNAIAGGARGGDAWLLDSNYDWGQHDGALREWLRAHPGPIEIDPDPLAPRTGRIAVGATALRGILGPGPLAYAWLRDRAPDARVGITWRVFDVGDGEIAPALRRASRRDAPARTALARHVLRAASHDAVLHEPPADPRAELALANACNELLEYDCAVATALGVLRRAPGHRAAFWLASEVTARRRLGVLVFEGRALLDGFAPLAPADAWLAPEELAALAPGGPVRDALFRLHRVLGDWDYDHARHRDALAQWSRSAALDPDDFEMQYKLAWLLAATPVDADRDPARALALARANGERAKWRIAASHDLLAVALAANGRFEEAVAAADRALALARSDGTRAQVEARRRGFERGAPYLLVESPRTAEAPRDAEGAPGAAAARTDAGAGTDARRR